MLVTQWTVWLWLGLSHTETRACVCVYACMHVCIFLKQLHACSYLYVFIEGERDRETYFHIHIHVDMYIYIYTHYTIMYISCVYICNCILLSKSVCICTQHTSGVLQLWHPGFRVQGLGGDDTQEAADRIHAAALCKYFCFSAFGQANFQITPDYTL